MRDWQRSKICSGGQCVEVCTDEGQVLVRDGKRGDASPVLAFSPEAWANFSDEVNSLDLAVSNGVTV